MSLVAYRLGDLIERVERTNADGRYGVEDVRGVTNAKGIIKTKASTDGRNLDKFLVVGPNEFAFNRRVHDKLGLGLNQTNRTFIFTNDYVAFRVKDPKVLDPVYLYLFFCRDEFDRGILYNAWGSATLFFNFEDMCRVEILLPPIEEQRKAVESWQGLRKMKADNEQMAEPLMQLCRSYLEKCKKKYPLREIGPMIERVDSRNSDNSIRVVKSVSVTKEFKDTNAKVDKSQLQSYKIVRPGEVSFVQTTGNEKCLCIAVSHYDEPIVVTSVNEVFAVNERVLLTDYLYLWWSRKEADRYARFNSWGSARETFSFVDMCRVKIPLPPLDVQQAVVDLYRAANEAKKIAAEADSLSREMCPALVRRAAAAVA